MELIDFKLKKQFEKIRNFELTIKKNINAQINFGIIKNKK